MDKSTLEKANDIKCKIESLKEENNLLSYANVPHCYLFKSFKKLILSRTCTDGYITITVEDAKAMIELRKQRIAELEKELEQL